MNSKNEKIIKIATLFSGIGSFEQAIKKLNVKHEIIFACDNGERYVDIDDSTHLKLLKMPNHKRQEEIKKLYFNQKGINKVKETYMNNYDINESKWYDDIRYLDASEFRDQNIDIIVGGSPCQSFSLIGKRAGLDDTRGTLFYDFARIIKESQPKSFIFENVPGMLAHDKGNTWKVIKEVFDSLGYKVYDTVLNAKDFGIPQNRNRLFVVGFKDHNINFSFPKTFILEKNIVDFLDDEAETKHYLGKKGFEFVTNPKYKNRAKVNPVIASCQKANQQFNWNGDFVFEPLDKNKHTKEILDRAYLGEYNGQIGIIRQLTYREVYRLMGFDDSFKIINNNVKAYRQAGNSIVVDVLVNILKSMKGAVDEAKSSNSIQWDWGIWTSTKKK